MNHESKKAVSRLELWPAIDPEPSLAATAEPIAIIGLGCRFPGGANTPDKFWELLNNGVDTVTAIPSERWDIEGYYDANLDTPGKMYMRTGAFLQEVDKFDASFFGITPMEALSLDPQQRLLLEVGWESLENAGIATQELRNSQTGMFIGSTWDDYSILNFYQDDPKQIDAYRLTSILRGMHAGRLSYVFQLQGPSMQIDTACSSSLLAIHLACQSLRTQECHLAVAGGVGLVLSPEFLIAFSRTRTVSPDGRCKTFAAKADGFGVGEGAGAVVLKRFSEAKRDGDKILAIIRGSAVNHDGPSNNLTAPNGLAQEALLRQALKNAHLSPDQIDYIEAHGTGTPVGDRIEVNALGRVFTPNRTRPLIIGAVKSNIGHLLAAAGIASLIKVVLSLQHDLIPANLHFADPSPYIRWAKMPFIVPTKPMNWPSQAKLAGISSFGMTGTNVHLIVGAAPPPEILNPSVSTVERPFHLLTLSGKTESALSDQVTRYLDYLTRHPELNLADVCYTANTGRVHFEHRLAVTAKDLNELRSKLQKGEGVKGHLAKSSPRPVAFLFTGQGSQSVDMGRELFETHPLFRQVLEQCEAILRNYLRTPLLELLYGDEKEKQDRLLAETQYTQPALFALEYALAKLWQSWGVEPAVLIGHSVGEYVAACVAEVFSLEDGLKLIAERGRLMQALPQNGSMVAVTLDEATLTPILQPYLEQVSIASFNAPHSLVLSGHTDRVEEIIKSLETQGIKCKRLAVSHAFHSPLMTPMLAEFERVARSITYNPPRLQLVSNVTGQLLTEVKAEYWVQHVRQPVRFAQGLATVADLGVKVFIEVGPKPTLLGLGQLSVPGSDLLWLPSLYPKQSSDWLQLLESLGMFQVHGGRVDWRRFDQPYSRQKVSLPTYPFQRQRYWLDQRARTHSSVESRHPLIGELRRSPTSAEIHFQTTVSANSPAYLTDHRVFEQPILPGTAYLEMALAAGQELFEEIPVNLTNITFQQPLMLTATEKTIQLVFTPVTEGYHWQIFSWQEDQQEWQLHSVGEIQAELTTQPDLTTLEELSNLIPNLIPNHLAELQSRCATEMSVSAHYQSCADLGLHYGPEFQGLEKLFQGESEALGLIRLSPSLQLEAGRYQLHPALLDACLQVSLVALSSDTSEAHLPLALERFQLDVTGPHQVLWSYAQVRPATKDSTRLVDFTLFSEKGSIVAQLTGLMLRPASRETVQKSGLRTDWLYQLTWQTATLPTHSPYTTEPGRWLIIGDQALSQPLADLLQVHGEQVVRHQTVGETYRSVVYLGLDLTTLQEWSNLPEAALKVSTEVLQLVQGLIQGPGTPRLWLVIQEEHLASSVLWGLGRTLMWEHPELQCSCLELSTETAAATLFETLWYADSENQLALRHGTRQVARLVRYQPPPASALPLNNHSSYLITGGLGGLGLKVAAWLVEQGVRHLVLSNRRGLENEAAQQAVHQLENLGVKVLVVKADVSQEADVARLLAAAQQFAPLRGIIHAAGLLDDGIVLQQTPERLAKVLAPKVQGSWYLHQFSQDLPLEFFVGFSSVASLLGHAGQANYAAANAFLDALMSHRQARGLPGLSINWSAWSEVGMAANIVGEWGKEVISPAQGVALLGYLLNHSVAQVGVIPWQWANFGQQLPVGSHFPPLTQFLKPKVVTTAKSALRQQLAQASGAAREKLLKQHLRAEIQIVVGMTPTDDQGFFELGMDSLQSIQLGNRLAASLEVSLPAILTLAYPTVEQLTRYLAEQVLGWKNTVIVEKNDENAELKVELLQLSASEVEASITQELIDLEGLLDD